ncbi:MAG: 1-acyl-sn-glycerol-3-phosphate acyltransferase [Actinomycetota bacterium]|nr:1-acyl-sn-glycerol-3-phosphate acyltransferase [Actinomycetota bacterium]
MGEFERASPFFSALFWISRPFLVGLFRLRACGLEHVPREGGFVVAANHTSNLDPWPLAIPLYPRQVHYMAKAELYRNPVFRWILEKGGAFPVRRGERDSEAFKAAVRYARRGGVVAMFPEGTRRAKGIRKKYVATPRLGAARIALAAGVPLVPAAIAGTDRLARLAPIRVAYGAPIEMAALDGRTRRETAQAAIERLMEEISRLEASL